MIMINAGSLTGTLRMQARFCQFRLAFMMYQVCSFLDVLRACLLPEQARGLDCQTDAPAAFPL
jgi:hypothetical protein